MLERIAHEDILELKLSRPPVNALDPGLIAALREAVTDAPRQGAAAVVISGGPGLYSAGLDVPALLKLDRAGMLELWRSFSGMLAAIACSSIPSVAAITGHSPAGGTVLALNCDYRVMADGPFKLGLNETQVGLALPRNILASLQRLLGPHRAERHIVAGNMIDAAEALRIGLVNRVVPYEELDAAVDGLARKLAAGPPLALKMTKRALNASLDLGRDAEFDFETYAQTMCLLSDDHIEGATAFKEKRAPVYHGR